MSLSFLSFFFPRVEFVYQLLKSEAGTAAARRAVHQMDFSLNMRPCRAFTKHAPVCGHALKKKKILIVNKFLSTILPSE